MGEVLRILRKVTEVFWYVRQVRVSLQSLDEKYYYLQGTAKSEMGSLEDWWIFEEDLHVV